MCPKPSDIQAVHELVTILHALACAAVDYVRCSVAGTETTLAPDVSAERPKNSADYGCTARSYVWIGRRVRDYLHPCNYISDTAAHCLFVFAQYKC